MNSRTRITLVAAAVAATLPAISSAVQLEDYLIANSSYEEAFLNGQFSANDSATNDQVGYNLTINADFEKNFSTLPRSWRYGLTGFANSNRAGSSDDLGNPPAENTNWGFGAEGNIDTYFHQSAYPQAFWFGQGNYSHEDDAPDDNISVTAGLGYGRVYNATPLAKVLRVVEELNEEGLLTGPIPDAVLIETAEIVDREEEFKSKFGIDEYQRDFYAAIEAALARSGAIRDGKLGALGALTMDEVLDEEPISVRKHGWVVRAGAGFQASDISGLSDNDPKLLFSWEYAKPYGYKGQFINLLSYEPVFGDTTIQVIRNAMSYTHELSDRVDWVNSWTLSYSDGADENGVDGQTTTHQLLSSYRFFLSNRLNYTANLTIIQTDVEPNPINSPGDDPTINFTMGANYRLK